MGRLKSSRRSSRFFRINWRLEARRFNCPVVSTLDCDDEVQPISDPTATDNSVVWPGRKAGKPLRMEESLMTNASHPRVRGTSQDPLIAESWGRIFRDFVQANSSGDSYLFVPDDESDPSCRIFALVQPTFDRPRGHDEAHQRLCSCRRFQSPVDQVCSGQWGLLSR